MQSRLHNEILNLWPDESLTFYRSGNAMVKDKSRDRKLVNRVESPLGYLQSHPNWLFQSLSNVPPYRLKIRREGPLIQFILQGSLPHRPLRALLVKRLLSVTEIQNAKSVDVMAAMIDFMVLNLKKFVNEQESETNDSD